MFENLIIYCAPALALGIIVGSVIRLDAIHALEKEARKAAQAHLNAHKSFVNACKDANALEDELANANASIARLTDAPAAKNARLERIYEKGSVSKSGAAVHLAKIAMGDA